ncbi:hypothetical protein MBLNU230_g2091t1 [Neophaeotheca triangularis]
MQICQRFFIILVVSLVQHIQVSAADGWVAGFDNNTSTTASASNDHLSHYTKDPPFPNNTIPLAQTGSGFDFATNCEALIRSQSSAVQYYQSRHGSTVVDTLSNTFTAASTPITVGEPTKLVTLCDGHPRVVGSVETSVGEPVTSTTTWYNTNTNFEWATSYTKPPPCSILPDDCISLWSTWSIKSSSVANTVSVYVVPEEPPCANPTTSLTFTYSTNSAGRNCDNCMIVASTARLLYWPVTTAQGSYDLCENRAPTVPATRTQTGPNTFVTHGLTITSPTVAISFGMLSRADGCGPTMTSTVVPVNPDEVSSVRGYRVFFTHMPFNYADLNMECIGNSTDPDNCFTAVPAAAYFGGLNRNAGLEGDFEGLTVYNDYKPQMLMPKTMEEGIFDTWGDHCVVHPDGVWDPPQALQPVQTIIMPTFPGGASAKPTPHSTMQAEETPAGANASPGGAFQNPQGMPTGEPVDKYPEPSSDDTHEQPKPTSMSPVPPRINESGDLEYKFGHKTLSQVKSTDDKIVLADDQGSFTLGHGSIATWDNHVISAGSNNMLMIATVNPHAETPTAAALSDTVDHDSAQSDPTLGKDVPWEPQPFLTLGTETYALHTKSNGAYEYTGHHSTLTISSKEGFHSGQPTTVPEYDAGLTQNPGGEALPTGEANSAANGPQEFVTANSEPTAPSIRPGHESANPVLNGVTGTGESYDLLYSAHPRTETATERPDLDLSSTKPSEEESSTNTPTGGGGSEDGNENYGNENDGNENNGNENDGNENDGNENDGNENDGNENDGNENDGSQSESSAAGRVETFQQTCISLAISVFLGKMLL